MEEKLSCCVCITTYNRPIELFNLVSKLQKNDVEFVIKVFDDGSDVDYDVSKFNNVEFIKNKHHGKKEFWKLFDIMFKYLKNYRKFDRYLFLQDDMDCCENVISLLENDWKSIKDEKKIALNPVFNIRKFDCNLWNSKSLNLELVKFDNKYFINKNFIDCIFYCDQKFFNTLNWEMHEISKDRWQKNENLGSGVGMQLTNRLYSNHNMYGCIKSYISFRSDVKSYMNESERIKNPSISVLNNDFNIKKIASLATIPRREPLLRGIINSILPHVDTLFVILNGYDAVPEYLLTEKIKILRSQDIGDFTDAGKFYPLVRYNLEDCIYFSCDDDIEYPEFYFDFLFYKCLKYNNKIITLHGRKIKNEIVSREIDYYKDTDVVKLYGRMDKNFIDTPCDFGGTGVMCFNTAFFKIKDMSIFKMPCSADIWVGLEAKKQNIEIMCSHGRLLGGPFITNGGIRETHNIFSSFQNKKLIIDTNRG